MVESVESSPARPAADAETLARRALGIAINSVWGGAAAAPLPPTTPALARDAQALLRERVPACRERELALELLAREGSSGSQSR